MPRGAMRVERAVRMLATVSVLAVSLASAACGAGPGAGGDETTATASDAEVLFPQQRPGGESMMAEISGELVLDDDGCLRVKATPKDPGRTPVWPAGYGLDTSGGEVRVLDEEGRIAAKVGERVYMGGGEIPKGQIKLADERMAKELFERCPGGYWVVGSEVKILHQHG
jgi:hypothetical protein